MPVDCWLDLIERCISGLNVAAAMLSDPDQQERFSCAEDWFCVPGTSGYWRGIKVPMETSISGALCTLFNEITADQLVEGPQSGTVDLRHIHVAVEQRRAWEKNVGKRKHPTDLAIVAHSDRAYDLRIEAKNIQSVAEIRSNYLGSEGLGRFDDAKMPYTLEEYGGMVAYVFNESARDWRQRILIELQCHLGTDRLSDTVLTADDLPTSKHTLNVDLPRRKGRYDVKVVHVVIEVDAEPRMR